MIQFRYEGTFVGFACGPIPPRSVDTSPWRDGRRELDCRFPAYRLVAEVERAMLKAFSSSGNAALYPKSFAALILVCLSLSGCAIISAEAFREGVIQSAYVSRVEPRSDSPGKSLSVSVSTLDETRRERNERQNLWLCALPVGSFWAYWERPDWLLWQESHYAAYKPAGRDMAELLAKELQRSKLFHSVSMDAGRDSADLILEGDIRDLTLTIRPHFYGTSFLIGTILGQLGLPLGRWAISQTLDLRLLERDSEEILLERTFSTSDGGRIAAYYGKDPMRCGYPADTLIEPVVQQVIAEIENVLIAKGETHWATLAKRRVEQVRPPVETAEKEKPKPPPVSVPLRMQGWALVVGISTYEHADGSDLTTLAYADDDANDFATALKNMGWSDSHIKLLINDQASEQNVRVALESWLTKARPSDLVILFWSGHGFPSPADPEKTYLACYDTDISVPATGYRMDKVRRALDEIGAKNVVILADTCHAGKLITRGGKSKGLSIVPSIERMHREQQTPKGWIWMLGADSDRKAIEHSSWRNGAFTHCLLKGLAGAADGFDSIDAKDDIITMRELRAYISATMPEETQKILGTAKHPLILTSSADPEIWSLSLQAK